MRLTIRPSARERLPTCDWPGYPFFPVRMAPASAPSGRRSLRGSARDHDNRWAPSEHLIVVSVRTNP